jgi:hypothetical protein
VAAGNSDTQTLQAVAVPEDRIFQAMTGKKKTLKDLGLIKFVATYVDDDVHLVHSRLINHETLDKIMNILEDESVA